MAFQRGSQINPALGRTDFTPFLQGALAGSQMAAQGAGAMGQGLAGLMSGVGQGIDAFQRNKEENKKLEGFIKAAEKMSAGFEAITDKLDPRITQSIAGARETISNPALSIRERASAAQAFLQQAPTLLNGGFKMMEMEQQAKEQQAREAMASQQFLAQQQAQARNQMVQQGANAVAMGGNVPSYMPNAVFNEATLAGRERAAKLQKAEMEAKPAPAKVDVPSGYRPTAQGGLEPIPGGPAAQKLAEEAAKAQDAKRMADERAALVKEGALSTLARVQEAFDFSAKTNAGGTIEGLFPKVTAALFPSAMGSDDARVLESRYDTIKAALALDQIQQLKELSKSGATGLGSVSNKELDVLQDAVAKLDVSLPESEQRKNLQVIANTLAKIGKVEAPKLGAQPRPNTLKGGSRAPASQRYQIVQ